MEGWTYSRYTCMNQIIWSQTEMKGGGVSRTHFLLVLQNLHSGCSSVGSRPNPTGKHDSCHDENDQHEALRNLADILFDI